MLLTYLGHSGFALEADGKTVLIDPWVTGNPLATVKADDLRADTILLSHAHNDHGIDDAQAIAKRTGATVISTFELGEWLSAQGVKTNHGNHGGTMAFDGGSVKLTPAWHTSSYQTGPDTVVAAGVPAGLVIRFGGMTIYHTGDTALFRDMELIGEAGIDLMCVCIGDHFTMGPDDAVRAVRFVRPKAVIPMHYNTFPPIKQDGEAFKRQVEADVPGVVCYPLKPGAQREFGA
ncbi:MAG: metal-dependent hydrolase [Chloroflexota bacterium]|nr:metal-dependent hydrolase [Chloroflexota bacterium]